MSGAGELSGIHSLSEVPDGDRFSLVVRRLHHHPPATVWRAITDPEQVRQWFLTTATIDGRVGGDVDLLFEPVGLRSRGRVVAWEPPRLFEYEVEVPAGPKDGLPAERNLVRWEVSPAEGGSLLVLTQRRLSRQWADVGKVGLPYFVLRLEALLDGRPAPAWETRREEAQRFDFHPAGSSAP